MESKDIYPPAATKSFAENSTVDFMNIGVRTRLSLRQVILLVTRLATCLLAAVATLQQQGKQFTRVVPEKRQKKNIVHKNFTPLMLISVVFLHTQLVSLDEQVQSCPSPENVHQHKHSVKDDRVLHDGRDPVDAPQQHYIQVQEVSNAVGKDTAYLFPESDSSHMMVANDAYQVRGRGQSCPGLGSTCPKENATAQTNHQWRQKELSGGTILLVKKIERITKDIQYKKIHWIRMNKKVEVNHTTGFEAEKHTHCPSLLQPATSCHEQSCPQTTGYDYLQNSADACHQTTNYDACGQTADDDACHQTTN